MRIKLSVCFLLVIISAVAAHAAPNATLFGGYQYTRFDGGPNANGWNAALTGGFSSWLGLRADFSAAYPAGFNFYTYTLGPELSVPCQSCGRSLMRSSVVQGLHLREQLRTASI